MNDARCSRCGCPVQPLHGDDFPSWCPDCHELEKQRIAAKASLGPQAPPAQDYSIESQWFRSRLTERRTPLGGPLYSFNGWSAEQIKSFFREHGIEPPISDELFHSICLKIAQDDVDAKGKTLRQWETLVLSLFEIEFKGTGKRRRASGHGYAGGDGYVDIHT